MNELSFREKQDIESRQKRGENIFLASATTTSNDGSVTYTVKTNDTLSEIAESFGISASKLRSLNNLNGSRIFVGQLLKIK